MIRAIDLGWSVPESWTCVEMTGYDNPMLSDMSYGWFDREDFINEWLQTHPSQGNYFFNENLGIWSFENESDATLMILKFGTDISRVDR